MDQLMQSDLGKLLNPSSANGHTCVTGSRIGWAIVADDAIADLMRTHIWYASGYVQENQLRAAALLQYLLSTNGVLAVYVVALLILLSHPQLDVASPAAHSQLLIILASKHYSDKEVIL